MPPPIPHAARVTPHDDTELKRAQTELMRSQDVLRRLAAGLDSVQENERRRIASELHDDLQQTLAAIGLEVGAIRGQLAAQACDLTARLDTVRELAITAIAATRRIVNDLRPPILEELGLAAALDALVAQVARRTGMRCRFQTDEDTDAELAPAVVTSLYRTAQQALSNVTRHAGASAVTVQLQRDGGRGVLLRIADNGRGMAVDDRRRPFTVGLLSMQERLRALGGELRLESRLGAGTTVEARAPSTPAAATSPQSLVVGIPREPDDDLLRFLHRAPVGLVQAALDGQIEMLNPTATRLLMPFSTDGRLDNLFGVLKQAVPHLRHLSAQVEPPSGVVCESLRIELAPQGERGAVQALSLSMLKQAGGRLMAVLGPAEPDR
ncbi:histidine kinase [Leptothrix cholodnii SP-6]|uniref:Histidine kinase n=1 Tax=Leptothrix cholodnii (strain ATCC 51168 / LMG 8142 / SP-6) TaxID=395495 RepID=B1Y5H2_LEPCP|nr:sensor histidine kinase [Leptothrix cholodnii]ACB34684.1 histidine kinase [Leptothrix cholodnii SP-6]